MEKEVAITHIEKKLVDLDNPKDFKVNVWTNTTCTIIEKIFIVSHDQKTKALKNINYYLDINRYPFAKDEEKLVELIKGIKEAKAYLKEYINEINEFGIEIFNEPKKQIEIPLQKMENQPEKQIIALIKNEIFVPALLVLISGAFTLGFYFGHSKFDKDKTDYYNENVILKVRNDLLERTRIQNIWDINDLKDSLTKYKTKNEHAN